MAGRHSALRGSSIILSAHFLDAGGSYADPTDLKVSVYPVGKDPEDPDVTPADAWVYDVTLTSGGSGPEADPARFVIREATGKYSYTFPIPSDADLGGAFDRWQGVIDSEDLDATFSFTIVGGGSVGTTQLYENNLVTIRLASTIADTDGHTLGSDLTYYFTTAYTPMYSAIRRIRLDLGPLVASVPNDTINLAIFEASLYVDSISFLPVSAGASAYLSMAKRELTTCYAELILIGAAHGAYGDGLSKRLGDLSVGRSGGNLKDREDRLRECMARWEPVVQSGGSIASATSLRPQHTVKGSTAEDAVGVGREWEPTSGIGIIDDSPIGNSDYQSTARRWIRSYRRRD